MCAICGIVDYKGNRLEQADGAVLSPVLDAMRHRGPDGRGIFCKPPVVLGANRLAIMDLTDGASQPMTHRSGAFTLVFNGEIYNYRELRQELELLGEKFVSDSDTEVVLAMYTHYGPECLHRFRGMFAFAVWNNLEDTLFLARDRVGEKPLVYYHDGFVFAFASEIQALLQLSWVPRRIDETGLHLGFFYVHAPAPWTAFRDIRRLPPGSWMEVSRKGVRSERYWSCRINRTDAFRDLDAAGESVASCLDDTTVLLSRSDRPLGATLSGGLDSGAVVASLSKILQGVPTFRISSGAEYNESEYASSEAIAQKLGTRHHQFQLPSSSVTSFDDVVSVFGEPVATPVMLDAQHLAQQAKPFATVLLTGTGGDELFGGYPDHGLLRRLDRWRLLRQRWPGSHRRPLSPVSGRNADELLALPPGRVFGTLKFADMLQFATRVYGPKMNEAAARNDPIDLSEEIFLLSGAENLIDGFLAQELMLVNQYSLTSILDSAGMRHAVEFRSPFLDVRMIELAMRVPARLKIGSGGEAADRKLVLRSAMRNRLPQETLCAAGKTGFGGTNPYGKWLHTDPEGEFHRKLTSPALADLGLFDIKALEELWLLSSMSAVLPIPWLWGVATTAAWIERYF
jgi:asparagine synthase (glutamine-hydrolysing)